MKIILGRMGPLSSAEFVKIIYQLNLADLEKELSAYILYYVFTIFARTNAIINDSIQLFLTNFRRFIYV